MADGRFALYWSSATVSYVGDGVRFAALPLLAATLTSSPAGVASIAVAAGLPWLFFGLVAGVLVDRVDRMRLMALAQLVRAGAGAAVVIGIVTDGLTIPVLAALVFVLCTAEVGYDIAFNSTLPAVVDRSQLQWANGRLITAEVVMFQFVGPALGGLLFTLGASVAFAFDAVTFVASSLLLMIVARRIPTPGREAAGERTDTTIMIDLRGGSSGSGGTRSCGRSPSRPSPRTSAPAASSPSSCCSCVRSCRSDLSATDSCSRSVPRAPSPPA